MLLGTVRSRLTWLRLAAWPLFGCSLVIDSSQYLARDAGHEISEDAVSEASSEGGCDCSADQVCIEGACRDDCSGCPSELCDPRGFCDPDRCDRDGDGYLSADCQPAPEVLDCDDEDETTYPGSLRCGGSVGCGAQVLGPGSEAIVARPVSVSTRNAPGGGTQLTAAADDEGTLVGWLEAAPTGPADPFALAMRVDLQALPTPPRPGAELGELVGLEWSRASAISVSSTGVRLQVVAARRDPTQLLFAQHDGNWVHTAPTAVMGSLFRVGDTIVAPPLGPALPSLVVAGANRNQLHSIATDWDGSGVGVSTFSPLAPLGRLVSVGEVVIAPRESGGAWVWNRTADPAEPLAASEGLVLAGPIAAALTQGPYEHRSFSEANANRYLIALPANDGSLEVRRVGCEQTVAQEDCLIAPGDRMHTETFTTGRRMGASIAIAPLGPVVVTAIVGATPADPPEVLLFAPNPADAAPPPRITLDLPPDVRDLAIAVRAPTQANMPTEIAVFGVVPVTSGFDIWAGGVRLCADALQAD